MLDLPYKSDGTAYKYPDLQFNTSSGKYEIQLNGKRYKVTQNLDDVDGGIFAYTGMNGEQDDNLNVMYLNGNQDFTIASNSKADFNYNSTNGYYEVDAENIKNVSFTKSGSVSMTGVSGNYEVALVVDGANASTPWTETRIKGSDSDVSISQTKNGLVVSGEDLSKVTVVAVNDNGESTVNIDTEKDSVLITGTTSSGKPSPTVYEDTNGDGVYETPVAGPEVLSLSGSSLKKTVKIGDKFQIDVPDLSIKSCKSSKTKVAAVSDGGYVVAKGEGSAKNTVTLTNKKKRTLSLTVVDPYKPSGISLAQGKTATLSMGDTLKLSASLSPATARTTLTWKSSKTKIAKVDSSGVVAPVAEGKAKITVTTANKKKAEITVTVVDPYKPSSVSISEGKIAVLNMGDTVQLNAVLAPATARSTLTWKSSKTKIATVDSNGIVTPKGEGTAKITVTTSNKKTATISIHVVDPYKPTGVTLNQTGTVKIGVGQTIQLYAALSPDTARTTLTWSSSAKKYATVTNTGLVTGVKKGSAKITVKTANGKKATVKITVDNTAAPADNWLSNFESGKSGIRVYSSAKDKLFHSNSGCAKASGTQVKYTLENALNSGKEPCPTCMASAAATVYASKDDPYYHTNKSHAKSGAIATNAAKARAYGLAALSDLLR